VEDEPRYCITYLGEPVRSDLGFCASLAKLGKDIKNYADEKF